MADNWLEPIGNFLKPGGILTSLFRKNGKQ